MQPSNVAEAAMTANAIQLGMFALLGVGQIATFVKMNTDGTRRAVRRSADEASAAEKQTLAVAALAQANDRIAKALESLDAWARGHELADAKWQSTMTEVQKQTAETLQAMRTMQENMQRQITNVALGLAPEREPKAVPATRRAGR